MFTEDDYPSSSDMRVGVASAPQLPKQAVWPQLDAYQIERTPQQVMQLARADPGLLYTHGLNQFDHNRVLFRYGQRRAQLFVLCLSANPVMTAGCRNAQSYVRPFSMTSLKGL